MVYLIDTQILIWFELDNPQLKPEICGILTDGQNEILVSEVSLLEIAIKQKVNKLPELTWDTQTIVEQLAKDDFRLLPIKTTHIAAYPSIPFFQNHRDPLDRLLLATALAENVPIISADEKFLLYPPLVTLIPA